MSGVGALFFLHKNGSVWNTVPRTASWMIIKAEKCLEEGITMQEFMWMQQFSIKRMYQVLQGTYPKVGWRKLICNN